MTLFVEVVLPGGRHADLGKAAYTPPCCQVAVMPHMLSLGALALTSAQFDGAVLPVLGIELDHIVPSADLWVGITACVMQICGFCNCRFVMLRHHAAGPASSFQPLQQPAC